MQIAGIEMESIIQQDNKGKAKLGEDIIIKPESARDILDLKSSLQSDKKFGIMNATLLEEWIVWNYL